MTMTPEPIITCLPDGQKWIVECSCGWTRTFAEDYAATSWAEEHSAQCHLWRVWATEQVDALPSTLGCYIPGPLRELLDQLLGDPLTLPVLMRWLGDLQDDGDDAA